MPDVSIIIVNYNTYETTSQCIESIFRQTLDVDFEVILVDNASTDASRERFSSDDRITCIFQDENLGFGRANNAGLAKSNARNVLFLNPDTILINNAVKILSDFLDSNPSVGACGGNLYSESLRPEFSFSRFFPGIFSEMDGLFENIPSKVRFGKNANFNHTGKPLDVAYISGADLMVRKSTLDRIGAFNPKFFLYFEETELCWRIRNSGLRIMSVPDAKTIHLESKAIGDKKDRTRLERFYGSRDIYLSLTHSPSYRRLSNLIWRISIRAHMLIHLFDKDKRDKWKGYRDLSDRYR